MKVDSTLFTFLSVVFLVISVVLWGFGEDIKGCIAHVSAIMCLGFSAVIGKLDDINKK